MNVIYEITVIHFIHYDACTSCNVFMYLPVLITHPNVIVFMYGIRIQ